MKKEIRDIIRGFVSNKIEYNTYTEGTTINEISALTIEDFTDTDNEKGYLKDLMKNIKKSGFEVEQDLVIEEIIQFTEQLENMLSEFSDGIEFQAEIEAEILIDYHKEEKGFKEINDLDYIEIHIISELQETLEELLSEMKGNLVDDFVLDSDFEGGTDHNIYEIDEDNKHADRIIRKLVGIKTLEIYKNTIEPIIEECEEILEDIESLHVDVENAIKECTEKYTSNLDIEDLIITKIKDNKAKEIIEVEEIIEGIKKEIIDNFKENDVENYQSAVDYFKSTDDVQYEILEEVSDNIDKYFENFNAEVILEKIRLQKELSFF